MLSLGLETDHETPCPAGATSATEHAAEHKACVCSLSRQPRDTEELIVVIDTSRHDLAAAPMNRIDG
jgi:hypothetical protein